MRRDDIDFFIIADRHLAIHERLVNWSRYVRPPESSKAQTGPIWKLGKSNGRQWHEPVISTPVDSLDGHRIEKAISQLPEKHREAIRWSYVHRWILPHKVQRSLGVTREGLMELIVDARSMLVNRRV